MMLFETSEGQKMRTSVNITLLCLKRKLLREISIDQWQITDFSIGNLFGKNWEIICVIKVAMSF